MSTNSDEGCWLLRFDKPDWNVMKSFFEIVVKWVVSSYKPDFHEQKAKIIFELKNGYIIVIFQFCE